MMTRRTPAAMRLRLLCLLGLAAALPAASALAQAPAASAPPTFRESVEVRVMDLDVSATDSKGNPVADLNRDEFRVTVDGKAVPIDFFTRVAEGTIHSPDLAAASPDRVLAEYRKGEETYIPREFLMYVDVGNLSPSSRKRGVDALKDLVTRMGANDRGRVVLFDRRAKQQTDWTSSKEDLLEALSKIEAGSVGMSRLMTEIQTLHLIDGSRQRSSRAFAARSYAEQERAEVGTMLRDMAAELTTLSALPGKRAFIFVSGGFDMQPGSAMAQYAMGSFSLSNFDVRDMGPEVSNLTSKANGSDVTFYTLDARGLTAEGATAGGDDPLLSRPGVSFFARQDSQAGLQTLATETGGMALLNTNAFSGGLARVFQDVSTYYSIGVNLTNLPGPGSRKVAVTVSRPGVTVRARRSYAARTPEERAADVAQAALRSGIQYRGIPLSIATAPATKAKKYYTMPIVLSVPATALTFLPDGKDGLRAAADVYFGVMDDSGNMSDIVRDQATFTLPVDSPKDSVVKYQGSLQLRKGNARIVANLRDRETGKMGTARTDVHVE